MAPFELGQLHLAVHARHFPFRAGLGRHHGHAVSHGHGNDIGQVVLALRIIVRQGRQPAPQVARGRDDDAAIDLLDGAFLGVGVFFLDDAANFAIDTHDAAQPEGVGLHHGQDRQLVAAGCLDQAAQRVGAGQRHVAVEDQRGRIVGQQRQRLHHGVARAQLGLLQRRGDGIVGADILLLDHGGHRCAPMTVNNA